MNETMQRAVGRSEMPAAPAGGHKGWYAAGGGLAGALGAASCCLIPFALFSAGASGAWIGRLGALSPYQPAFAGFALACLAAGFYVVYRGPKAGARASGSTCARPGRRAAVKAVLWAASALVAAALGFPYLVALLV